MTLRLSRIKEIMHIASIVKADVPDSCTEEPIDSRSFPSCSILSAPFCFLTLKIALESSSSHSLTAGKSTLQLYWFKPRGDHKLNLDMWTLLDKEVFVLKIEGWVDTVAQFWSHYNLPKCQVHGALMIDILIYPVGLKTKTLLTQVEPLCPF